MNFDHLHEQNISYWKHLFRVWKASAKLVGLGFVGFIHGVLPWLCVNTVTNGIKEIEKDLTYTPSKKKMYKVVK